MSVSLKTEVCGNSKANVSGVTNGNKPIANANGIKKKRYEVSITLPINYSM